MPVITIGENTTDTYAGWADANNYQPNAGGLFGAFTTMVVDSGATRYGFVRADGISSIPAGSTINAVSLFLYQAETYGASRTMSGYRTLVAWIEGQLSWDSRTTGVPWDTAGGFGSGTDRSATQSLSGATTTLNDGYREFTGGQLITDVQRIHDGLDSNLGWTLVASGFAGFHSKEGADGFRPYLRVDYTASGGGGGGAGSLVRNQLTRNMRVGNILLAS